MLKVRADGDCFSLHRAFLWEDCGKCVSKQPNVEANDVAMTRVANNWNICIHMYQVELTDFGKRDQLDGAVQISAADRARYTHLLNWTHEVSGLSMFLMKLVS